MEGSKAFQNRWAAVPEHEAYGRPKPELPEGQYESWCVIDVGEDDPPIATCDMKAGAIMVAEALNLMEFMAWVTESYDPEQEDNE